MKERNYGIDLLRLIGMFFICVLHINGQGGAMLRVNGYNGSYYACWFLETAAYCAVDIYGLISGFAGVDAKHRPSRLAELWLRVFWYSALGSFLAVNIFHLEVLDAMPWKALFPVSWKTYWYFSSYVGVFVTAPYLNRMVLALTERERKKLFAVLFVLCSVCTMIPRVSQTGSDFLGLGAGYSFLWLSILYVMGACLKKIRLKERPAAWYISVYFCSVVLSWLFKIQMENYTRALYGKALYGRVFTSYTAPTMVICAVSLLLLFQKIKVRSEGARSLIRFLAPMSFSVYLVQVQPYVWEYLLKDSCRDFYRLGPVLCILMVLLSAFLLYCVCTAADLVRVFVFRILHVRKACEAVCGFLQQKLDGLLSGPQPEQKRL